MREEKFHKDILETIGNTPLVKLKRVTKGLKTDMFAKLEFMNPIGSVKDRIAKYMIEKAEKEGRIKPGDTIIDSSSGNTAAALAVVCGIKGYKVKMVVRDNISLEKIKLLKSLNVELIRVNHTLPPDSPDSYNNITPRIVKETPGGSYFDQHNNRDNIEAHYFSTGPEIWEQMEGKIDYFVTGIGTGGTICGTAKYLKEKDPGIKAIGVDPAGSVFFDYFHSKKLIKPSPYLLEGLGDEFLIGCVDFSLIDDIYQVTDKDAFLMARKLADVEGILAGGSSGANFWAALKLAREIDRPARIVTVFSDSASRYLSTIFDDEWLREKGFI
ncbi:MAG: pyridoxal-phosphate dependent enzyme [Candidatus Aminicenantes bacterium]|nr:pyridoxal-phosphate dependent enzyme [Candidatus Aminicenantes bacterium]